MTLRVVLESIEKIELPKYLETIWSGGEAKEIREAPILATYRTTLSSNVGKESIVYELRNEPHGGPLIDEYYEDEVYDAIMRLLSSVRSNERAAAFNRVNTKVSEAVYRAHLGDLVEVPMLVLVGEDHGNRN